MAFRDDISQPGMARSGASAATAAGANDRYLINPIVDFLFLGGGSLLLFPFIFLLPLEGHQAVIAQSLVFLAFLINYPHFMHSYQIFYRNFLGKAFGTDYNALLRSRYIVAGIVVPVALVSYFIISVMRGDALMLGFGANAMFLLVGWHYVKQGYGILMVDAAYKRQYFQDIDKRLFRLNAYVVWFVSWLVGNNAVSQREYLNLHYYTFEAPAVILYLVFAAAMVSGALSAWVLFKRWRENGGCLPMNGVLAYIASLYLWILGLTAGFDPIWLLLIPTLHSLQYLVVVWRYQLGVERDRPRADEPVRLFPGKRVASKRYHLNFLLFVLVGMLLGVFAFWAVPIYFNVAVDYDTELFGVRMFTFMVFIFINVHHYFLDNVMWRRENPDMRRYLFN